MDVTLSTDGRRIAELLRHGLDGVEHLFLRFVRAARARLSKQSERLERCKPGAEVFRGKRPAARFAQVLVHIAGVDRPALAVLVEPLEQLLPGNIAAIPHDT